MARGNHDQPNREPDQPSDKGHRRSSQERCARVEEGEADLFASIDRATIDRRAIVTPLIGARSRSLPLAVQCTIPSSSLHLVRLSLLAPSRRGFLAILHGCLVSQKLPSWCDSEPEYDMINSQPTNMSVADYCAAMDRNEIMVNNEYQRSDRVWPDSARSYLIESVLLGYPIAKFYLHFITDVKARKTIKEIVDGQQRSRAIYDFYNDRFKLSNSLDTEELRGLTYSALSEGWQEKFISYSISIDLFVGAEPQEVREVFRRMNSYTVPLNPEELRHAENQGAFKWFISRIGNRYSRALADLGVFADRAVIRMQDLKLLTELCHALLHGITTTNSKALNAIYKENDEAFSQADDIGHALTYAFDTVSSMRFLKGSNIAKPYQIYSLALALAHTKYPVPGQENIGELALDAQLLEVELLNLSAALDLPLNEAGNSPLREFIEASSEKTNTKDQRTKRFFTYLAALRRAAI